MNNPAMVWLPIETAPKNGTQILLWGPDTVIPIFGWWQEWDAPNRGTKMGWVSTSFGNPNIYPTHWMELTIPSTKIKMSKKTSEVAWKIVRVLRLTVDRFLDIRDPEIIKEAERIRERYQELRNEKGFVAAAEIAKAEYIESELIKLLREK